jgi:hypothetical protein
VELSEPLKTWTRTLDREAALTLLEAAEPEMSVEEWRALGDQILPQPSAEQRTRHLDYVQRDLLDIVDGKLISSAFLRLYQEGTPHRREGLLAGRLAVGRHGPLIVHALNHLIGPALRESEEPLTHPDAGRLEAADWDRFLRSCLRPGLSDEVIRKTRTSLQRVLAEAGCLDIQGNQTRTTFAKRGRPDGGAFSWLIHHQLRKQGMREAFDHWAARDSFAAKLFATAEPYALTCLEAGVTAGLFTRSYLAGEARIQLVETA